ncbi:MAG: phosphatase PAP2 family protein [Firmicutes bacterium]|nr:phosphatase PAP2 family protein [Bacillota bacterium]
MNKRGIFIAYAVLLLMFGVITVLTFTGVLAGFDLAVYDFMMRAESSGMTWFMENATHLGSIAFIVVLVVVLLAIPRTRKSLGYTTAIAAVIGASSNELLKLIFRRPRPEIEYMVSVTGHSFPSGHTQGSTAVFIMLALMVFATVKSRKIKIPLIALCAIIPFIVGITRIYLGVHFATDVMAGWVVGIAIALAVYSVYMVKPSPRSSSQL